MDSRPLSRRLLLGRLGSGTGIVGTFLLPGRIRAALAATGPAASQSAAMTRPQLGPRSPPPLVMLDPGHGGKDPGAIGISGTYEKQVALAMAFELKRQLEAGGRYRVALTRARDAFIPLDDPGGDGAGARRGVVRLDACRCTFRSCGAWRQRLYTCRYRFRRADRGAGAAREQRRPFCRRHLQRLARSGPHTGKPGAARKLGSVPAGWPAPWSAISTRICRCCRIRSDTPASSC